MSKPTNALNKRARRKAYIKRQKEAVVLAKAKKAKTAKKKA